MAFLRFRKMLAADWAWQLLEKQGRASPGCCVQAAQSPEDNEKLKAAFRITRKAMFHRYSSGMISFIQE